MHAARGVGGPAGEHAAQMVGVDFQAYCAVALRAGKRCAAQAQCFGQQHRHAALRQALGLMRDCYNHNSSRGKRKFVV